MFTLVLGWMWSGVLAFFAAPLVTKPLGRIEHAAKRAADGDIREDVTATKSDDELRSLALAYNDMVGSIRKMVGNIEANFKETNQKVAEITEASESVTSEAENSAATIGEISQGAESSSYSIQNKAESVEDVTVLLSKFKITPLERND
ncbi:HAMP domain-containing protein [Salsuginibacillus kocurii]|uniref:HAMP domain-containing protein n=1 Tax=Salsuginibacillus kocurii TaxID=427078 RepID=UPI0003A77D53|nr:methyl-accepting chemotaxis protein [Salsuginibacillus kocurii]